MVNVQFRIFGFRVQTLLTTFAARIFPQKPTASRARYIAIKPIVQI
jgi:hypothetical protein